MPTKPEKKAGLRMNELMAATRLPKSTILHYSSLGLLPEPVKTSPNMAYYDPTCIDRIRLVQQLQRNHRLSLGEVKKIMTKGAGDDAVATRLALNELVFGSESTEREQMDERAFCAAAGLAPARLRELLRARLILPLQKGRYDPEDVAIGRLYVQALSWGFSVDDFAYYSELGVKMIEHEFALRNRITGRLSEDQDAAITLAMLKNARAVRSYTMERLFQQKVASMRDLKDYPEKRERATRSRRGK